MTERKISNEDAPPERVIYEREVVTDRDRGGFGRVLLGLATIAVLAVLVVVVWAAVDDEGDPGNETLDDVQEEVDDLGGEIRQESGEIRDDITDGE